MALPVTAPDGSSHTFVIGHTPKPIRVFFTAPPGSQPLVFASNAPISHPDNDPRNLAVRYNNLLAANASIAPFLGSSPRLGR